MGEEILKYADDSAWERNRLHQPTLPCKGKEIRSGVRRWVVTAKLWGAGSRGKKRVPLSLNP